jgi:plasmid maintenance system antidote protein VapI
MKKQKPPQFAKILRDTIRESGLALQQVAEATGVDRASLSRFMRGERTLRLDMASKAAAYFDLVLVKRKGK